MNVTSRLLLLSASAVLFAAGAAKAEEQPMRQLLAHGYTIVGTAIVPSDFSQRAMGSDGWKDELLITLQRGDSVAFCHTLFAATVDNDAVLDVSCFVPAGLPPAASSQAPPSSEAPPPPDAPASSEAPANDVAPPVAPPPDTPPPPAAPVPPPPAQ